MPLLPPDDVKRGDPIRAADWNTAIGLLRGMAGSGDTVGSFADGATGVLARKGIQRLGIVPVFFGAPRAGGGMYAGTAARWNTADPVDTTTDFDASADTSPPSTPITIKNVTESNLGTHRVGSGVAFFAWPTGQRDDSGLPVYETIYNHAIRYIRFNEDTGWLQVTYNDAATIDDVPEENWINAVKFESCDGTTTATVAPAVMLSSDSLVAIASTINVAASAPENRELLEGAFELLASIDYTLRTRT